MSSSKLRALQFVTILKLFASCVTKVMKNMTSVIIDDMEIFPTSTIKSIVLLNKHKVGVFNYSKLRTPMTWIA